MHILQALVDLSGIRVNVIWKKVIDENLGVSVHDVRSSVALRDLYLPWYVNNKGTPTDFDDPEAKPVTVGQVADNVEKWPEKRAGIEQYISMYKAEPPPFPIRIPAYRLPDQQALLLDGSHRAVALALAGTAFAIDLRIIEGPNDPSYVPDLRHWQK